MATPQMKKIPYAEARKIVQAGDVVAFGGESLWSRIIRRGADSQVSHAGIIVDPLDGNAEPRFLEATIRLFRKGPVLGAKITSFENRWNDYDGNVWLLPLAQTIRDEFDQEGFDGFVAACEGKLFDIPEGVIAHIKDFFERLLDDELKSEEFYYCSELVADAFKAAGILDEGIDPSDVLPKDLCRWEMYEDTYYAREDADTTIPKFNSFPPGTVESG